MSQFTQSWKGEITPSQNEKLVYYANEIDEIESDWWAQTEVMGENWAEAEVNNENLPPEPNIQQVEKRFIPLDNEDTKEIGQNSEEWYEVMKGFKSKKMHMERLQDFVEYATENPSELTLIQKLVRYFDLRGSQKNDDGSDKYKATTMRSWVSVFMKFWKFVRFQNLKALAPIIEVKLGELEKVQEEVKQAKVFEIEELVTFLETTNSIINIADKAYAIIALSFGGRGGEVTMIEFKDVTRRTIAETGEIEVRVAYKRTKTKGVPKTETALITGEIEIKVITDYENCFLPIEKTGRYFRKMKIGDDGIKIRATKQVLGHNTTAKTGVRIASTLRLNDPELYTGHTFRQE